MALADLSFFFVFFNKIEHVLVDIIASKPRYQELVHFNGGRHNDDTRERKINPKTATKDTKAITEKTKGNESSYGSVWLLLTLVLASSDFLVISSEAVQLQYLLQSLQVLSHVVIRSRLELLLLKENGMFVVVVVVSHFDRHERADRFEGQGGREN